MGIALTAAYQSHDASTSMDFGGVEGRDTLGETTRGTWLFTLGANVHLTPARRVDLRVGPFLGLLDLGDPPSFDADTSFALGAELGVDVPVGRGSWGVTGRLRFVDADVDLEGRGATQGLTVPFDYEVWSLGDGLLFRF